MIPRVTHTHASPKGSMCGLHPARKGSKAHVHAKETDENERDDTDEIADEEEPSEEGQPMNQTSL